MSTGNLHSDSAQAQAHANMAARAAQMRSHNSAAYKISIAAISVTMLLAALLTVGQAARADAQQYEATVALNEVGTAEVSADTNADASADANIVTAAPAHISKTVYLTSPINSGVDKVVEKLCEFSQKQSDAVFETQIKAIKEKLAAESAAAENKSGAQAESAPIAGASNSASAASGATAPAPNTINVNGTSMGYVNSYLAATAPSTGAGLWLGSDSTTDGSWGYFIGHNPGDFWCVMQLATGDAVTVTDGAGASRTYHVITAFTVPDTTYWEDIESQVTGYGESVILQTCCGDHANYRIVIAN